MFSIRNFRNNLFIQSENNAFQIFHKFLLKIIVTWSLYLGKNVHNESGVLVVVLFVTGRKNSSFITEKNWVIFMPKFVFSHQSTSKQNSINLVPYICSMLDQNLGINTFLDWNISDTNVLIDGIRDTVQEMLVSLALPINKKKKKKKKTLNHALPEHLYFYI